MHFPALFLTSLVFRLARAIDPEPLKCLHKVYLQGAENLGNGTFIGEVTDLSASSMRELLRTYPGKYSPKMPNQMYITGYCVPPSGFTAFTFERSGKIQGFDMELQNIDSVPGDFLAELDPQGNAQQLVQFDVRCDAEIGHFNFSLLVANQTNPYRLKIGSVSWGLIYGVRTYGHESGLVGMTRAVTLFPEELEDFHYGAWLNEVHPDFPENFVCLAELVGRFEQPLVKFDTAKVTLKTAWGRHMSSRHWVPEIFDLSSMEPRGTVRRYWVRKDGKGVFFTKPFRTLNKLRCVLGVISA